MRKHLHWLSSKYWEWWFYFKSRTRQILQRLWDSIAFSSVLILVFSATISILVLFQSHGKFLSLEALGALEGLNAMISLVGLGSAFFIFSLVFVLLFILSLHLKGRKIADKLFGFTDFTKLELLEKKVERIENELPLANKRLGNIESRLGNIEITLKGVVKSINHAKHRPMQKSKRGKAKRKLK